MTSSRAPYVVDPADPRAPSQDIWDRLTISERVHVVASLPHEFEPSEAHPPEGDFHYEAVASARDALKGYFGRLGRRIYIGSDLPVYYPGEAMISADVQVVTDVDPHLRNSWVVSVEGKGLDLAIEVHVRGDYAKDTARNLVNCARLGIAEYFVVDVPRLRLLGYRQPRPGEAYQPIIPQQGRWASGVLGLDLMLHDNKLRFFHGMAALPESAELIVKLGAMLDETVAKKEEAERLQQEAERLQQEAERSRDEAQRTADAEIARLKAELEDLRRRR